MYFCTLGYIVSASTRKTAGGVVGFSVVVQSSTTLPQELEARCEAWLENFRKELEAMPADDIAQEGASVVAQLLERNMRFSDEVGTAWGSIVSTSFVGSIYNVPPFDRHKKLAEELYVDGIGMKLERVNASTQSAEEFKAKVLKLWDRYFNVKNPERRVISTRVYGYSQRGEYEKNIGKTGILSSYDEVRQVKQFLDQYPIAPYWISKVQGEE